MRAIWTGALSFGLVHIPVKLYPAIASQKISFRQLHQACQTPIRYQKVCPTCRKELAEEEIQKGFEYQKGKFVLFEPEELERANPKRENIQIQAFHKSKEVDPLYFDKSYYLEATAGGTKAYRLLVEALESKEAVALALFQLRTHESLCLVRPTDGLLTLTTLFYAQEVRKSDQFLKSREETTEGELEMAKTLIDNLSRPFQPEEYENQEQAVLMELVEKKLKGEEIATAPQISGQVIDLVEALKASVEATAKPKKRTRKKA